MLSVPVLAGTHEITSIDYPEKIGIDKIRLRKIGARSTTILRSIARADILLHDWHKCALGEVECEFEVRFIDGYLLTGKIGLTRDRLCRPSLRRHLETLCDGILPPDWHSGQSNPTQARFLDFYEVDL